MWKIQLTITIIFVSSKEYDDGDYVMYSNRDNIEIMINDKAFEGIEELFKSPQNRYENNFKKSMKGSDSVFDYVHLLY